MVLLSALQANSTVQRYVLIGAIAIVCAYFILPALLMKGMFPLLWIITFVPWLIFNGNELYQMAKIKFGDSGNYLVDLVLAGGEKSPEYFRGIDECLVGGRIIPGILYVIFGMMVFGFVMGSTIGLIIGLLGCVGHLHLRKKFMKGVTSTSRVLD